ncbi:tetratricopeptide repeat protein [Candidatus Pelagibacter sp.]|nr:tetratricopeptide repeat protein [Candidatus Pelagibacter sp.]
MKKLNINPTNPSNQQLNNLLNCYQTGRYIDAEKLSLSITKKFPSHPFAWKVLGIVLKKTGRINEALVVNQKSVELEPTNMETNFNLGNTLLELGKLEEAEACYRQAISIKPDYAEAHNNLGVTLQKIGKLEEAMKTFIKIIKHNPNLTESYIKLIELLTIYDPQEKVFHPIVKIAQEIKENNLKDETLDVISNNKVIKIIRKSSNIIKRYNIGLQTHLSQVYRRNSIDLNCKRHKAIFNKFNIIPKFCFGCYKVQVEPRSVIELIKLLIVFDQIKLDKNNTRKCMIEMRQEVSGFYKGLIYCAGLEEAYQVANYLKKVVEEKISSELSIMIKRGCSEYTISFPDYKEINKSGPERMSYNENWKSIEKNYDSLNPIKSNKIIPTFSGISLHDILIVQNWIDYAKGIGDTSLNLLGQTKVFSPKIFKIAKKRIEKYPWQK